MRTRVRETRVERVEAHQRVVRAVAKRRLLAAERVDTLRRIRAPGAREGESEDEARGKDQGRRAARLPSATHGRDASTGAAKCAPDAEICDFVMSGSSTFSADFGLKAQLRPSELIARVRNL